MKDRNIVHELRCVSRTSRCSYRNSCGLGNTHTALQYRRVMSAANLDVGRIREVHISLTVNGWKTGDVPLDWCKTSEKRLIGSSRIILSTRMSLISSRR